jgi:hypothetical protein
MRPVLLAVVVLFAVTGCGGGSDKTTAPSEPRRADGPPSNADYAAVGDTICANHRSRREDLESQARELGPITSPDQADRIAGLLRQERDNRLAEADELGEVQTPAPMVSMIRAEAKVIGAWASAYAKLDSEAIRRLRIQLGAATARAAERARAYGFKVCGQQ